VGESKDLDPLVIYTIFPDEGAHSRAPAAILEGQAQGYYAGKVVYMLVLIELLIMIRL
jgi:hypothetical protein